VKLSNNIHSRVERVEIAWVDESKKISNIQNVGKLIHDGRNVYYREFYNNSKKHKFVVTFENPSEAMTVVIY
jgi:hypothetical protein